MSPWRLHACGIPADPENPEGYGTQRLCNACRLQHKHRADVLEDETFVGEVSVDNVSPSAENPIGHGAPRKLGKGQSNVAGARSGVEAEVIEF